MKSVFDACHRILKAKASTQKTTPLKMDAFRFTNNGKPLQSSSGRAGDMVESREVAKIHSVILDEYISVTQQVLSVFKYVSHCSIIKHVKSAGLIVQTKQIKVAIFH